MLDPKEVKRRLIAAMPDADIVILDLTGTRDHYQVRVTSDAFLGKSPLERHRSVYRALEGAIGGSIHALSVEAKTYRELE